MKKVYFKTFGCRTNIFDTQIMMANLKGHVLCDLESHADVVVVNSCTVTNGADSSVRHYINRLQSEGKRVLFTGCGARTLGARLFEEGRIDGVFDHARKEEIASFVASKAPFEAHGEIDTHLDSTLIEELVGRSRAFIKIQEGCDFACSYCIIPSVRGRVRSVPETQILAQISTLAQGGVSEFVLTGTNVGSYGRDRHERLGALIPKIAAIEGVRRIRIGSLEPSQVDSSLLEIMGEPFMERHLHVAIQHASDTMLELMNRPNRTATDESLLHALAAKGLALGTDFIVGHPGESEACFSEALEHLERYPLTHIHLFTYSPREGTPSSTMPGRIHGTLAKERFGAISAIIARKNREFRSTRTEPLEVLIEQCESGVCKGLDQFFNPVRIHSASALQGRWITLPHYKVEDEANIAFVD